MKKRFFNSIVIFSLLGLLIWSAASYLPDLIHVSNTPGSRDLPIYCVETHKPQIAISFDAAWGNEDTQTLLDILSKYNIKATFFMTGGWVESYPDDVKNIYKAGHDLGNHSEHHKYMTKLNKEEQTQELMTVHQKVKTLTDYDMFLFRPPYGDYDNQVISNAKELNYYPIQWNIDSLDWKDYGADDIVKRVTEHKNLSNGSIILCHNGAKYTKDALERVITTLQDKGYEFVPISELIYRDHYHMNHEGRQIPEEN